VSHVFKKQSTDDVPEIAKVFTKNGKRFARWVTAKQTRRQTRAESVGRSPKANSSGS